MLGLTGFLGLTQISQIPRYSLWVGNLTDGSACGLCSRGFHFAFGLTQISQYCFVGGKSHRCFCVWAGSHGFRFAFGLTQISQIPRYCFVGGKSHRCFCVWAGSHGFRLVFGLTQISQIPRYSLWVGNLTDGSVGVGLCGSRGGTLLSLSRTYLSDPSDLSDLSDGLDISLIGRIGHF